MGAPMPELILAAIALGFIALTLWAYARASRLHRQIEALSPGFNHLMAKARRLEYWCRSSQQGKGRRMFKGFKTYITAAIAVITAAAAYLTGEASLTETLQLVFTALMGAFIRSGVKADTGQ